MRPSVKIGNADITPANPELLLPMRVFDATFASSPPPTQPPYLLKKKLNSVLFITLIDSRHRSTTFLRPGNGSEDVPALPMLDWLRAKQLSNLTLQPGGYF